MGLGRIKGNPFWLEVWCQNKKYVAAMLILDHVSITLQCNHKRVFISMVYKTADSRKWLFICYLCLQFLLCFDKEGVLLDLKLYIYQLCCSYLFFVCFLLRIFYGHPKDFIIMILLFVFCIVLVMRKIKVLPLTYRRILARTRIVLEDYNMSCDDVSIFFCLKMLYSDSSDTN